jgi:hypothetical protein
VDQAKQLLGGVARKQITRMAFMPPAVEPAQPPTAMISTSNATENGGQALQFAVLNAVPVVRLALWKRASRNAMANEAPWSEACRFAVIKIVLARITPR